MINTNIIAGQYGTYNCDCCSKSLSQSEYNFCKKFCFHTWFCFKCRKDLKLK